MELSIANHIRPAVRILIFGHKDFSQLMSRAVREFSGQAQFKLYDAIIGSASEVQPFIREFEPHVIVSAGANAAYLRSVLDIPVVSLNITEEDWTSALNRAAKVASNIDVVCFDQPNRLLGYLAEELGVELEQHVYHTSDQAREAFHVLRQKNNNAVVGASLVCGLANQYDLPSVLVYSHSSCKQTIEKAIEIGHACLKQNEAQTFTHWLLNQSKTPIILTDSAGTSYRINKAARQELGLKHNDPFSIHNLIKSDFSGWENHDGECEIQGKEWWYHCDHINLAGNHRYVFQLFRKNILKPQNAFQQRDTQTEMVCESPQMREVVAQVDAFAASPGNVLIYGESGTGKELVARSLHVKGPYAKGQFIAVNCGAIPAELFEGELFGYHEGAYTGSKRGGRKGLIESARDGVLFLDEISELQPLQQTKLLRVIQERRYRPLGANEEIEINVKLIAASNRSLHEMVNDGEFREDLYYRLNVFKINVPALRHRKADIRAIGLLRLNSLFKDYQVEADAPAIFDVIEQSAGDYQWPGNIRELENVAERVVAWLKTGHDIDRLDEVMRHIVPEFSQQRSPVNTSGSIQTIESKLIIQAMQQWGGDRRKAAEQLGMSPTTLWRRLKKLDYKN